MNEKDDDKNDIRPFEFVQESRDSLWRVRYEFSPIEGDLVEQRNRMSDLYRGLICLNVTHQQCLCEKFIKVSKFWLFREIEKQRQIHTVEREKGSEILNRMFPGTAGMMSWVNMGSVAVYSPRIKFANDSMINMITTMLITNPRYRMNLCFKRVFQITIRTKQCSYIDWELTINWIKAYITNKKLVDEMMPLLGRKKRESLSKIRFTV